MGIARQKKEGSISRDPAFWNFEERPAVPIGRPHMYPISPPVQGDISILWELQGEENKYERDNRATVQRSTSNIIEFTPPGKVSLPDEVLE